MTNLFLNDGRTVAMSNRQQVNSDLSNASRAGILGKIKPIFFQHFEQAVEDCCMRIDLEFGLQLGRNREKMGKDQYTKLLEYLRLIRRDIKQNYLSKVSDLFDDHHQKADDGEGGQLDFSKISLIGDDAVKENHAITQIIRQCERLYYEELTALNKHLTLQRGKQAIADGQNPIFPEKLVRALVEVVKPLKLNTDARIALYKAFEANVFSQLGFIYGELMTRCETAATARMQEVAQRSGVPSPTPLYVVGEIREAVEPVSANAEQPSAEFRLLQEKLELWRLAHFPSAYDLISATGNVCYQQFEIKNALQVLQLVTDDSEPDEQTQPLKWRVLKKLEELSFSVDVRVLAKHDEDVLDLVALIFSEIEQDKLLEDSVKTAILRLEIPLAAASVGQYSIFTSEGNSVRLLLDDLFAAGMFLNADEDDDRLIQERIAGAVKKMTKHSGFELFGWMAEAEEFAGYLNKQKQRCQNIEQNARQFMINKQALDSSRKIASTAIENSMKGKKLPTAIVEFLRGVWADVLLDAYTHKDEQPEQWEKSVQAMDELIVSVIAPADDNERKQILKLLPGLIAELRHGLKKISYDKSAQSRFFKDLAVWHIILMDKKEAKKTLGDTDKAGTASVEGEQIKAETIADHSSAQANILAEGSWVAFSSESGRQWAKLLWKNAENMLFVGKSGVKIFEIQVAELAEKLRLGQAALVKASEEKITERVLSKLMSL
ncbi:DUF1631 family protein [Methylobacter tundripaludum]|uniref:DUF1631 family protein n=1 Tax=Methylobacter tundripaludum TaxID=173365 RepID=UPI000481DDF0|nr:DUF1631 family protein [Methylobacter tundripaludum]